MPTPSNKCPKCKRVFLSGGIDKNGQWYKCTYCNKKYKKILSVKKK